MQNIQLIHDNCLNALSQMEQEFSLLLTDPPYHSLPCGTASKNYRLSGTHDLPNFTNTMVGSENLLFTTMWLRLVFDHMVDLGGVIIFCDHRSMLDFKLAAHIVGFSIKGVGVLRKKSVRPNKNGFRQNEFFIWGIKPADGKVSKINKKEFYGQADYMGEYEKKRLHITQKPLNVISDLLDYRQDGVVLDPFMGSGTTAVACAQAGRDFIGIEMEKKYYDIAVQRVGEVERERA